MLQIDGAVYTFLKKISDLTILNLCCLVSCLPIVTIGAAIGAFFAVSFERKKGVDRSVTQRFWHYFKLHFKRSSMLFFTLLFAALTLAANMAYWNYVKDGLLASMMGTIALALYVPVAFVFFYGFAAISVYNYPFSPFIKQILWVAYKHPFQSIKLFLVWGGIVLFNASSLYALVLFTCVGFAPIVHVFISQGLFWTFSSESDFKNWPIELT